MGEVQITLFTSDVQSARPFSMYVQTQLHQQVFGVILQGRYWGTVGLLYHLKQYYPITFSIANFWGREARYPISLF